MSKGFTEEELLNAMTDAIIIETDPESLTSTEIWKEYNKKTGRNIHARTVRDMIRQKVMTGEFIQTHKYLSGKTVSSYKPNPNWKEKKNDN